MAQVTVVLCPPLGSDEPAWPRRELEEALRAGGLPVVAPHGAAAGDPAVTSSDERLVVAGWVADQAIAITAAQVDTPLILVASGEANRALPALGYSQRASRHTVVSYVMVDGPLPAPSRVSSDWPDAPVVYVHSPGADPAAAGAARLRGWTTVHRDPVEAVLDLARGWPDEAL